MTALSHAGNGTVRNVGVKNESEEEVLRQAMTLRSSAGRSTHVKVKERHVQPSQGGQRASPSVQVDPSSPGLLMLCSMSQGFPVL